MHGDMSTYIYVNKRSAPRIHKDCNFGLQIGHHIATESFRSCPYKPLTGLRHLPSYTSQGPGTWAGLWLKKFSQKRWLGCRLLHPEASAMNGSLDLLLTTHCLALRTPWPWPK